MAHLPELADDVEAVDKGFPRRRKQQGHEDLDQRGFAGTVGAEHAETLAAADLEVDSIEGHDLLAARAIDAPKRFGLDGDVHGLEDSTAGGRSGGLDGGDQLHQ